MRSATVRFVIAQWWLLTLLPPQAHAQEREPPKYEFRGVWITTVYNLDWPERGAHPDAQQASLLRMLDELQAVGINAAFFQVRSEADAMYASDIEPWTYWLTGAEGQAPNPFFDPLEMAVNAAHARGMELHAWFNPYRADRGSGYAHAPGHVTRTNPEWMLAVGGIKILNPGLPEVRDYIVRVIMDVVRRYDIDGVHFDDYFYPYPPNHIRGEDAQTFAAHSRGLTSIAEWRRDNVNLLVAQVADSMRAVKPALKFGISPFGIWKNGVPAGIRGLDAYNVVFADATAWLRAETVDYLVPQLYWPFGGAQDYGALARWWVAQSSSRHYYIGHGLYRADGHTFTGTPFAANEVPEQVRFNRDNLDILGSAFFRASNLTRYASQGFADTLSMDLYRRPALTPPMAWKEQAPPGAPDNLRFMWTGESEVTLAWDPPQPENGAADARFYAVYRVRAAMPPDADAASAQAGHLVAVTGIPSVQDRPGLADDPYHYFVRTVTANSIESAPSDVVTLRGRATSKEASEPEAEYIVRNYPNPFHASTRIEIVLDTGATVSLVIYNMLGQVVAILANQERRRAGTHTFQWDATSTTGQRVASGLYTYVLDTEVGRVTRYMVLLR